jgi:hypothetical protein
MEQNPLLLWPFTGLLHQHWIIKDDDDDDDSGDDCGAISGMKVW